MIGVFDGAIKECPSLERSCPAKAVVTEYPDAFRVEVSVKNLCLVCVCLCAHVHVHVHAYVCVHTCERWILTVSTAFCTCRCTCQNKCLLWGNGLGRMWWKIQAALIHHQIQMKWKKLALSHMSQTVKICLKLETCWCQKREIH